MGNGITVGTPGFKTNTPVDEEIDVDLVKQYGVASGNTGAGVTFSTFTLDKDDMANLIRLGQKARAVKGFGPFRYQTNVVQNPGLATNVTSFDTVGYQIATGGEFTNTNIYTDPYNASIAEYGTLSKAQANVKYVKNAAREFLKASGRTTWKWAKP